MGGIAGFVHFDKKPADHILLERMSSAISHRGPDGISYHISSHVGLCQLTSHITPESAQERFLLPGSSQKHLIVFHGRIDNRQDLYHYTGQRRPLEEIPDSQLVLAAYGKSGTRCVEKLLGDFAFTIWDEEEQTLFCGRDQMGVKPFFYINTGTFFAFASEIKGLFALPGIQKEINSEKIADFITCLTTENESTCYKNIFKLPPAHFLTTKNAVVKIQKYWDLEPADIQFKKSHEYQEAFFDIFKEAVHVRLRSSSPVGAYLSGGIDSASIVSMATGHLNKSFPGILNTFTGIFDQIPECDERIYFQSILDRFPIHPHYVHGDELLPGESFDTVMGYEDEPFFSPHFFMSWHLQHQVKQQGIKVLLDGHDGDAAVSYGYGLWPQLAMQGKLIRLYREFMLLPQATAKRSFRRILSLYRNILLQNSPFQAHQAPIHSQYSDSLNLLTPTFRRETNIEERLNNFVKTLPNSCQPEEKHHKSNISQPFHPFALEFLERTASRFGIEQRFPFFDIRLISFCLALPAEQKFKNGYNRSIVRQSLKSILPATIRQRKLKTNFAKNFLNAYVVRDRTWLTRAMEQQPHGLFSIINKDKIQKTYQQCLDKDNSSLAPLCNTLRYLALSKWLEKQD
ncbi:MAG: asparagine synthase (glutamine-hydrolyzing) [Proteobacteria bacterium]|nr:asparagine synthase (glutamine-hydrolyzing) [Pseudomonadota bacterium]MBU1454727.1 asparagine synthase (glutamine-hydrolyzing) [Pseudomonadota bacterium]